MVRADDAFTFMQCMSHLAPYASTGERPTGFPLICFLGLPAAKDLGKELSGKGTSRKERCRGRKPAGVGKWIIIHPGKPRVPRQISRRLQGLAVYPRERLLSDAKDGATFQRLPGGFLRKAVSGSFVQYACCCGSITL
jgi:hypothetical protein